MVGEVFAGLGAIKTALDIAKGLKDINDAAARNLAVVELTEKILAAREAQSTLLDRVSDLENEVIQLKDWKADKDRYQLADIGNGVVALALKRAMSNGEPMHYICADCAAKGQKSYLQPHVRGPHFDQYKCGSCGFEIGIDKDKRPRDFYGDPIDGTGGDFMT
jgi:DNA-directed RNA polymerase subunit RPC12/RpoP